MMMNGFDTNFDADNEVYAVNTVAHLHATRFGSSRLVRICVINVTEFDLVNSIHCHGMFFDAYRTGTTLTPSRSTDTLMLCQGERAILETRFRYPGKFMFRASGEFAELGWMGLSKPRGRAVIPETTVTERAPIARVWMFAILPLVLLAGLLFLLMRSGAAGVVQQEGVPPVERLVIERAVLGPEVRRRSSTMVRIRHHRAGDGRRCLLGVHRQRERATRASADQARHSLSVGRRRSAPDQGDDVDWHHVRARYRSLFEPSAEPSNSPRSL